MTTSNEHNNAHAVPQGWKLVPVEPTKEMIDAYCEANGRFQSARADWAAMLAATPSPAPAQEPAPTWSLREALQKAKDALSLALSDVDWRKDSPTQPVIHKAYNCAHQALALPTAEQVDDINVAESFTSVTKTAAPAQEVASAFTTALDIRLAQGWNLTGNAIPVLYTDTINDYQVRRDDVWLCTTDALKTKQEVGLTASQFDLICQAIVALDTGTITMEGNYMLDSDDCIAVVRVMQALFDIKALRAKGGGHGG